jgi:hypothetical protein
MDRSKAKQVSGAIMEALATIESDLGVTFSRGNGKFDNNEFSMKVTATSNAVDGSSRDKDAVAFETHAMSFGLKPSDLGHTFTHGGEEFTVSGLKPRSSKYPILAKNRMGKTFKFPIYATGLAKVEVMDYMRR